MEVRVIGQVLEQSLQSNRVLPAPVRPTIRTDRFLLLRSRRYSEGSTMSVSTVIMMKILEVMY